MGDDQKKVYQDLYEKYRVQDTPVDKKKASEDEKRKIIEDAYSKGSRSCLCDNPDDRCCCIDEYCCFECICETAREGMNCC